MYQSTDKLVPNEQGVSRGGYQTVEGGEAHHENATNNPDTAQTFFTQVKRAREENPGCCNFFLAFFALLIGSIVWSIIVIVIVTVPIVMIIIGAEYFHDCPVQRMIPITLVVGGCVSFVSNVMNFVDRLKRFSDTGMPKRYTVIGWINVFFNIVLFAWFIAACYYVYGTPVEFNDKNTTSYCNPHLYGFIFWLLNFVFIFFGMMVVVSALTMCLALMCW